MKIAVWLLAAAVVVASIIAGHWMSLNKLLRFEVQQLEQQNTALEAALASISVESCESHSPLAEQTLQELCIAYVDHFSAKEAQTIKVREADSWVSERLTHNARQKYRLLIAMLNIGAQEKELLIGLLIDREALLSAPTHTYFTGQEDSQVLITEQKAALDDIDDRIAALLNKEDRASFELLKDSDYEQYQLQNLQNSLSDSQKLSVDQQAQLLKLKLINLQQLYSAIEQMPTDSQGESTELKKQRLLELVSQYKQNYYQEAAMLLSEGQLEKLKTLEEAVFNQVFQSLAVQL